jgi:hypothetical protein
MREASDSGSHDLDCCDAFVLGSALQAEKKISAFSIANAISRTRITQQLRVFKISVRKIQ